MNLLPLFLLGLLVLPESIIYAPIFPFGKADAHPIHTTFNNDKMELSQAPVLRAIPNPMESSHPPVLKAIPNPIESSNPTVLRAIPNPIESSNPSVLKDIPNPIESSNPPVLKDIPNPIESIQAPVLRAIPNHMESSEAPVVGGRNPQRNPQRNPLECDACLLLANGLNQTVLHNPKVISIVTTDLEKICQVLPESVQQLCLGAAEQTAPLLLNHLGDLIATEGCSDLGICHSSVNYAS